MDIEGISPPWRGGHAANHGRIQKTNGTPKRRRPDMMSFVDEQESKPWKFLGASHDALHGGESDPIPEGWSFVARQQMRRDGLGELRPKAKLELFDQLALV